MKGVASMRRALFPAFVLGLIASVSLAAQPTEPDTAAGASVHGEAAPTEEKRVLTPEELAEKEARKACKQKICDIIATRDPDGADVACDIVKTWREEDIVKMLGGRISWPWGKAVCQSKLEVNRRPLALAMSQDSYEIVLPAQKVHCTLSHKSEGAPYVVEIVLTPRAKFENGKAVEAKANWGEASAPMLVYPLVYAGTALDNSANVLGGEIVRMINEFTTKKCAELKVEAPGPNAAP
jgi:hypothetical protein